MSPWRRTYWSVWFANLTSALGMMSFLPFFPSIVEELGAADRGAVSLWSGLCFGAAPLMAGIMGPFWGAFGDRFGRLRIGGGEAANGDLHLLIQSGGEGVQATALAGYFGL